MDIQPCPCCGRFPCGDPYVLTLPAPAIDLLVQLAGPVPDTPAQLLD